MYEYESYLLVVVFVYLLLDQNEMRIEPCRSLTMGLELFMSA